MDDERKYLIVLHPESVAAKLFGKDPDLIISEMPALACSEMDLSGMHARIKRIPVLTSKTAKAGIREQTIWISIGDIALAIESDDDDDPVGFYS